MKILQRYILKQFIKPFLFAVVSFTGIIVIATIFEHLKTLIKNKVSLSAAFQFFSCIIPSVLIQVTPIASLLGAIFCINQLSKNKELIIMKASGIDIKKIILPILIASVIISFFVFLADEIAVPYYAKKAEIIKLVEIDKKTPESVYQNISFKSFNRYFQIKSYDSKTKQMQGIQIMEQALNKSVLLRIDAETGTWQKRSLDYEWTLLGVTIRHFNKQGEIKTIENLKNKKIYLMYSPEEFSEINPEAMNIVSLADHISSLEETGYYPRDKYVDLFQKVAFPMASFFVTFLGIPFALRSRRSGAATGFGISIIIAFIYWTSMSIFLAWGKAGMINPYFAPFIPNIICLLLGAYLLQKTRT